MRGPNKRDVSKGPLLNFGKRNIQHIIINRIIIASCVLNVVVQIMYDIWLFTSSTSAKSCDVLIADSPAWTEIVWFISRSNACNIWILPFLYIFMPPEILRKACPWICKKRRSSGVYGET